MEDSQSQQEKTDNGRSTHDKYTDSYVGILNEYRELLSESVKKKNDLKEKFFVAIRIIMFWMLAIFSAAILGSIVAICITSSPKVLAGAIVSILSSFATMMASIFKLPKIIAKYLFNKKEDDLMKDIMKNIQTYEINASAKQDVMETVDIITKGSSNQNQNTIREKVIENSVNETLESSPHIGNDFPSDAIEPAEIIEDNRNT